MLTRVMDRPLPTVELVDMRTEFKETGKEDIFSRQLVAETQATLDRGEQVIILLNRRGYSFTVLCRSCGEKIECENCAIAMTYHKPVVGTDLHAHPGDRLECHYCGFRRSVPKTCPKCQSEHLYYLGAGSQQGEERLQELFPNARIGRMDRDTVRGRGDMERLLTRLHSGEINLLVGTQMIAKGHDIHGVTLVGVVGADSALGLPDFRAAERVFQLLTQVSGRAGRGELPGRVLVQTYHPEHYAIQCAAAHDYPGFVAKELQYRHWMHYPPSSRARQCDCAGTNAGGGRRLGEYAGPLVHRRPPGQGPRAGTGRRAHRAPETHLSLSLCAESRTPRRSWPHLAWDVGLCGSRGDSAAQPDCGCGCRYPDVAQACGSAVFTGIPIWFSMRENRAGVQSFRRDCLGRQINESLRSSGANTR